MNFQALISESEGNEQSRAIGNDITRISDEEENTEDEDDVPDTADSGPHLSKKSKTTATAKGKKKRKINESSPPRIEEAMAARKPKKPPSLVWSHYTIDPKSTPELPRAFCNYCHTSYACHKKRNGTTNMKAHLDSQCTKFPGKRDKQKTLLAMMPNKKESGGSAGSTLSVHTFDVKACREALAMMIMVDELPFKFVEGEGFRYFMSICQPMLSIPSRVTVARDCWELYLKEKVLLKNQLLKGAKNVCLTTDCWTSMQNLNYLCLTIHFIDNNWRLQKRILNFCPIDNHKGETIGETIETCLLEWGIEKVFTITLDNASANDSAVNYLKAKINGWNGAVLEGKYMHIRCVAHILNLIVNDGLKDMHESIIKVRNAVRYVRASPARMKKFKECAEKEKLSTNSLVSLDVPTRWNSTYLMLESALKFEKAFLRFEGQDAGYILDHLGEGRRKGTPSREDWDNCKHFVKFLKLFYDVTTSVSGTSYVTSAAYFHDLCDIRSCLYEWRNSNDTLLCSMAEKMKAKHDKYWGDDKDTNMLIFIAVILDPRYKFKFVEWSFRQLYDDMTADSVILKVKLAVHELFDYYRIYFGLSSDFLFGDSSQVKEHIQPSQEKVMRSRFSRQFDKDMNEEDNIERKSELEQYLLEPREKDLPQFDLLNWWKVNSSKYPILGQVARDVLAIPISTVASESAFSTGGRVINSYRSSLSPKVVEALICAENWFRSKKMDMEVEELVDEIAKIEIVGAGSSGQTQLC